MSGYFTRKMYDGCASQQDVKQSTDPLELILDVNKYVHCNNICKPTNQRPSNQRPSNQHPSNQRPSNQHPSNQYSPNSALLVDVESSLWGIDKSASRCDSAKHPFCGPQGCLLTKDPRIPPHITPYACERGNQGDNAIVTTNMKKHVDPGFRLPNPNICNNQGNGFYNQAQMPSAYAPSAWSSRSPVSPVSKPACNNQYLARN